MTEIERIDQLREELHRHNYNYYVLNAPEITDQEFDKLMRELQDLEEKHPEHRDENSPSMRVGSDINKNFTQVREAKRLSNRKQTAYRREDDMSRTL